MTAGPFGVYVHIPFCRAKCDYCAFATWTDRHHLTDAYLDALRRDIRRAVEWRNPANAVDQLPRHGGAATAALVVRPRPDPADRADNAARLAQQDQAPGASRAVTTPPTRRPRPALPAVPAHRLPTR